MEIGRNTFEMTKTTKIVMFGFVGFACIFVIGACFIVPLFSTGGKQLVLNNALPVQFYGTVDSIYRDKPNHNEEIAVLSDNYFLGIYAEWESKIELGDSLSKKPGSLKIEVYKKNGSKFILDYNKLWDDSK